MFVDDYRTSNNHAYLTRAAFADPCDARSLRRPCGVYGNLGAFQISGPGSFVSTFPSSRTSGSRNACVLQFRTEFFNMLNRANFGNPGTALNSSTFGQITSAANGRETQFALKLLF